jgi:hypothetical protein
MKEPGRVTISLDFEAGWGVIGNGRWQKREADGVYDALRPVLRRFVSHLDATGISCVWAVVGGMIDSPAERDISHLKGQYRAQAEHFLSAAKPNTRDGRDLLETVLGARCPQLFGTHGYSHVLFTDTEQDDGVLAGELDRARAANARHGLSSTFLVFPENRFGAFGVVHRAGISVARMPAFGGQAGSGGRNVVQRALDAAFRPPGPVVETTDATGLCLHHGTELLNWGVDAGHVKTWLTKRRIERALALACSGAHVHFWFHPFNLAETRGLLSYVEDLLVRLALWRDAGKITIGGGELVHRDSPHPRTSVAEAGA